MLDEVAGVAVRAVLGLVGNMVTSLAGSVLGEAVGAGARAVLPSLDPMENARAVRRRPGQYAENNPVMLPFRLLHEDGRAAGSGHFEVWRTSVLHGAEYYEDLFGDLRRTLPPLAAHPSLAGAGEGRHRFALGAGDDLRVVEMWISDWRILLAVLGLSRSGEDQFALE